MKRRNFLKYSGALSMGSLALNNSWASPFATLGMLPLMNCMDIDDRVMVIVFLKGGNDGGNTILPINQYDTYINNRPLIGLKDSGTGAYVPLDNTLGLDDQIGLNPAMSAFKSMYDAGKASVIQMVGYPDSNGSHFKSTDLWLTGGDGTSENFNLGSGWMARYLDTVYTGLAGAPTEANPDPIGIQLGDRKPSFAYYSHEAEFLAANLTQQDPAGLYNLVQSIGTPLHGGVENSEYGDELNFIMSIENSTSVYAQRITDVFNSGSNSSVTYPNTDLANQLKTVARLINGGCKTKLYLVHVGGFDTHSGQVQFGSPHIGSHANLLSNVFNSIGAFHEDLTTSGHSERVLTSTFSEFGRRMAENGSLGTDHGNFAPMFLFGDPVSAGVFGTNPDIGTLTSSGNLYSDQLQFDYRRVYKTLLQDWLGSSNQVISSVFANNHDKIPGIIETNYNAEPTCYHDSLIRESVVKLKVFLESFYDHSKGSMNSVPADVIPLQQPFNINPINYNGPESVTQIPENVVDWLYLELRSPQNINNVVGKRAAFLRNDGQVIGVNGGLGVKFDDVPLGQYIIVVYHKSHLAIASSENYDSSDLQNVYDFTNDTSSARGQDQLKSVNGVALMYSGDFNFSGGIDLQDYNEWYAESSKVGGYKSTDADGNKITNNQDFNLWKKNKGKVGDNSIQF